MMRGVGGFVVAQVAPQSGQLAFNRMLPWLAVLIGLALIGGVILFYVRHRFLGSDEPGAESRGFMDQLRAMRDRGEITAEEFEQTKLSMIARATGKDVQDLRNQAIVRAGGRVAQPGYDLLGRPLPVSGGGESAGSAPRSSVGRPPGSRGPKTGEDP